MALRSGAHVGGGGGRGGGGQPQRDVGQRRRCVEGELGGATQPLGQRHLWGRLRSQEDVATFCHFKTLARVFDIECMTLWSVGENYSDFHPLHSMITKVC